MCISDELLDKAKVLCEEEYKKSLVKKAVDFEFDTSYVTLLAITLALVGMVFANRAVVDEIGGVGLWIIVLSVGSFVIKEFVGLFTRRKRLLKLIEKEADK